MSQESARLGFPFLLLTATLAGLVGSLSLAAALHAQAPADHFMGKRITIIVGATPGGSYDVFGRLVARHATKYFPGKPVLVVQNIPGGGHLRGLRATMKAKPDGLTVGLLHPRWVQRKLLGIEVPDFDLNTVRIIGSPTGGVKEVEMTCIRRELATSWEEVMKLGRPVTRGSATRGGPGTIGTEFIALIGGPIKMVYGYTGSSEIMAAFDRGELDTTSCRDTHVPRLFPEWITKKILAPLFWWAAKPSEDWLRQLEAPMPPHLFDVVKVTAEQKKVFEVASDITMMDRIFIMPPAVPENILAAWRKAFEATVRDPTFVEEAKVAGFDTGLSTADEFKRVIHTFEELTPAGRDLLKRLVGE